MKKLFAILTICLFAMQLQAQDVALLNRINATNSQIRSFDADLDNVLVKPQDGTTQQHGKLYYIAPNRFAVQFTTGKYMIVNERRIKMNIGIFNGVYRLRDGGMMRSLSNIFLYGFQGRVQDLAEENNYNLTTTTVGNSYVVTGTVKRRQLLGIGYEKVIFKYHTGSLLLQEITLIDYSGNVDTYTTSNIQYDVAVDPSRFEF